MQSKSLGRVVPVHRGDYSADSAYQALDIVTYDGSDYIATGTSSGISPRNANYWRLYVKRAANYPEYGYAQHRGFEVTKH